MAKFSIFLIDLSQKLGLSLPAPIQLWDNELFRHKEVEVWVVREDLIHPVIQGNKWYKLRPWLHQCIQEKMVGMVSTGGPFSNHLLALAETGNRLNIRTIGFIRGEESEWNNNPFIQQLRLRKMEIRPVPRKLFRHWHQENINPLTPEEQKDWLWVPLGSTDRSALESVKDWAKQLSERLPSATHFILPVGSGGTLAGFALGLPDGVQLVAVPAWKGESYGPAILQSILGQECQRQIEWHPDYHFGGFGRSSPALVAFCLQILTENGFPLEPVYSGKAFYAVSDLIGKNHFPKGSSLVLVHTGGIFPWNQYILP